MKAVTSASIISKTQPLVDFLKKQQENERFLKSLESIATLFLIIFFLVFALRPTILTISALVGEIKSKELLQKQMRQKINNVIQAQDVFSQVQERYEVVNSSLPDSPTYTQIANNVQGIASESQLNLNWVSYDLSRESPAPLASYPFRFSGNFPFDSITAYLDKLSRLRRIIAITKISIAAPQKDLTQPPDLSAIPGPNSVEINFSANAYYWNNSNVQK